MRVFTTCTTAAFAVVTATIVHPSDAFGMMQSAGSAAISETEKEIAYCRESDLDYTPDDWAIMIVQTPTEAEQDADVAADSGERAEDFKSCLADVVENAPDAAAKMLAERALKSADREISAMFDAAKAAVEANPSKYLASDVYKPEKLKAELATLRSYKTLEQMCGTFDFSIPVISYGSQDYVNERVRQSKSIYKCMAQIYNGDRDWPYVGTFSLTNANTWVKATRRFTCAVRPGPGCINDTLFNSIAAIATDANIAFAEKQEKLPSRERNRIKDLLAKSDAWMADVNQAIAEFNEWSASQ
jgi:hypothetical protein